MKITLTQMKTATVICFERASGSDSLGPDKRHHLPQQILLPDNKQRISFVRYKSPLQTTGESL